MEFIKSSRMSPRTRFRFGLCAVIVVVLCVHLSWYSVSAANSKPKNVQVALRAKWPGTSILLEAGCVSFLQLNSLDSKCSCRRYFCLISLGAFHTMSIHF